MQTNLHAHRDTDGDKHPRNRFPPYFILSLCLPSSPHLPHPLKSTALSQHGDAWAFAQRKRPPSITLWSDAPPRIDPRIQSAIFCTCHSARAPAVWAVKILTTGIFSDSLFKRRPVTGLTPGSEKMLTPFKEFSSSRSESHCTDTSHLVYDRTVHLERRRTREFYSYEDASKKENRCWDWTSLLTNILKIPSAKRVSLLSVNLCHFALCVTHFCCLVLNLIQMLGGFWYWKAVW